MNDGFPQANEHRAPSNGIKRIHETGGKVPDNI